MKSTNFFKWHRNSPPPPTPENPPCLAVFTWYTIYRYKPSSHLFDIFHILIQMHQLYSRYQMLEIKNNMTTSLFFIFHIPLLNSLHSDEWNKMINKYTIISEIKSLLSDLNSRFEWAKERIGKLESRSIEII